MKTKNNKVLISQIASISSIACLAAYLIIGFTVNTPWAYGDSNSGWAIGWILLLAAPIIPTTVESIISKKPHLFPIFPIVLCTFLFLGMTMKLWHPLWLLFFLVPLYHAFVFQTYDSKHNDDNDSHSKVVKDDVVDVKDAE